MAKKVLDIDFRTGSLIDRVSGAQFQRSTPIGFAQSGKGLYSDGNQQGYLYLADGSFINFGTGPFSYVIAYRRGAYKNLGSAANAVFGVGNLTSTAYLGIEYRNDVQERFIIGEGGGQVPIAYTDFVLDNNFHFAYYERDSSQDCRLYFDNILFAVINSGVDVTVPGSTPFYIHTDAALGARLSDSDFLYLKIFDDVLTENERNTYYSDFLHSYPVVETKRNLIYPKPTDLSLQANSQKSDDLIVNGDFANWTADDPDNWNVLPAEDANNYITEASGGGAARMVSDGTFIEITQTSLLSVGFTYEYSINVVDITSGSFRIQGTTVYEVFSTTGVHTGTFVADNTTFRVGRAVACDVTFTDIVVKELTGLVAAYNMIPSEGGVLTDVSGNGNTGTIYGATEIVQGLKFDGKDDRVALTNFSYNKILSVNLRLFITEAGADDQYLFVFKNTTGQNIMCQVEVGTGDIETSYYDGSYTTLVKARESDYEFIGKEFSLSLLIDVDGTSKIFIDGVEASTLAGPNLSVSSVSYFGCRNANQYFFNGEIYNVELYNRILTTQEVQDYHNRYANEIYFRDSFSDQGVGTELPYGWEPGTGSYEIGENASDDSVLDIKAGDKYLECTSNGYISFVSEHAYGVWEVDLYKGDTANLTYFYPILDRATTSGANGYNFVFTTNEAAWLQRRLNGGGTDLATTAASYIENETWYRIKITRSIEGEFTMYIKGGSFGNTYTLIDVSGGSGTNPIIDNTYTTSSYTVLDLDTGDRIGNIVYRKGIAQ